ncbi:12288_t:CDS:2 [Entrophospora sp. SA101]|nr:12288_t:CDS:2 [Entrophospora sp. SA101]
MDEDMDEESGGDYSDDSNELDYDTLGLSFKNDSNQYQFSSIISSAIIE